MSTTGVHMEGRGKRPADGVRWAEGPDDPNFYNYNYYARPQKVETAVQSRLSQVETVKAKNASRSKKRGAKKQQTTPRQYPA